MAFSHSALLLMHQAVHDRVMANKLALLELVVAETSS